MLRGMLISFFPFPPVPGSLVTIFCGCDNYYTPHGQQKRQDAKPKMTQDSDSGKPGNQGWGVGKRRFDAVLVRPQ